MSWLAQLAIAFLLFTAGLASGIKYHAGQDALAAKDASVLLAADQRQQRQMGDVAVTRQIAKVTALAGQLGAAREHIKSLSGHTCLDADTVRLLNDIGREPVRAAASSPAGAPTSTATDPSNRADSSDIDIASAIAQCRSAYAGIAGQLNEVLDIEESRHQRDRK